MREIVLDTETTGLDPNAGHRITDIGCIELIDHIPTGRVYQTYLNPERDVPKEVEAICGLPTEFFYDKPKFKEIVNDFLDFIKNDVLVIHNAQFDIKFLNAELSRVGRPLLSLSNTVDTLLMARKMFPGSAANLDALCKRFNIDASARDKHGALLDSQLLYEVYINLLGGKQSFFSFCNSSKYANAESVSKSNAKMNIRPARVFQPTAAEILAHDEFIKKIANPIWDKYKVS